MNPVSCFTYSRDPVENDRSGSERTKPSQGKLVKLKTEMQAQGWNCESNFWKLGNRILYRILLGLSRGVEISKT